MISSKYNIIIIGGGISGLYTTLKLSQQYKVLLIDDRNYLGGRIVTYYNKTNNINIQYEIGAGRFHNQHKLLFNLIKEFNLTPIPLSKTENSPYLQTCNDKLVYIDNNAYNIFNDKIKEVINYSKQLTRNELQNMTFDELVIQCFKNKEIMIQLRNIFGYYAEFNIMNAYDAIRSFNKDFLVSQFYILKEGLSELCHRIANKIKKNGSLIINNAIVKNVIYDKINNVYQCNICLKNNNLYHTKYTKNFNQSKKIIHSKLKKTIKDNRFNIIVNKVIFCIKPQQLLNFKILSPIKYIINSVVSSELIRIYAIYPKNKYTNKVWFHNLPKITTNNYLRQIIPINYDTGLIMISYVDNKDCQIIKDKYKQNQLKLFIHDNLTILFPNLDIPKPIFFKYYYWKEGVHYWKKNINSNEISKKIIKPFNNQEIYIAGEGFSQNQAWMEGALETSKKVLDKII